MNSVVMAALNPAVLNYTNEIIRLHSLLVVEADEFVTVSQDASTSQSSSSSVTSRVLLLMDQDEWTSVATSTASSNIYETVTATASVADLATTSWSSLAVAAALSIIVLLTIGGNLLILAAVLFNSNLRGPTHILIANLAVADLLLGFLVLPFSATLEVDYMPYIITSRCFNFGN